MRINAGPDPIAPRCSWGGQGAVGSAPGAGCSLPEPRTASPVGFSILKWTREVKFVVVCSLQGAWRGSALGAHAVSWQHGAAVEGHKARCTASIRSAVGKAMTKCLSSCFSSAVRILSSCRLGANLGREGWRQDWHCAEVAEGRSKDQKCLLSYGLLKNTAFIWT